MKKHLFIIAVASLAFVRCGQQESSHKAHWPHNVNTRPTAWSTIDPSLYKIAFFRATRISRSTLSSQLAP